MKRDGWNRQSKSIGWCSVMAARGSWFLLALGWLALLLLFFFFLASPAHGQMVDLRAFPEPTIAGKVTDAQANGCSADSNVTCVIVIAPELGVFPTGGALPTPSARTVILDYRSPFLGPQVAFNGSNTLVPASFSGGSVTNPVLLPLGTCPLPAVAFTADTGTGWFRNAAGAWTFCTGSAKLYTFNNGGFVLGVGQVVCFGSGDSTTACDAGQSRSGPADISFGNGTAGNATATLHFRRLKSTGATAITTGDVGTLTGFGTTATVSAVIGNDTAGSVDILSNGTGQAANASWTLTFKDGTWTTVPVCVVSRSDGNTSAGAYVFGVSATTLQAAINGTPAAGIHYVINFVCVGR